MERLLLFIFWIIVTYYLFKFVFKIIIPYFIAKKIKKMQKNMEQNFGQQDSNFQDEIKVKYDTNSNKSKLDPNIGEYVDFEEIKETNKTESDEK